MSSECVGSRRRVAKPTSSAFPEVKCSECDFYAEPVCKDRMMEYWQVRVHRPIWDKEEEE